MICDGCSEVFHRGCLGAPPDKVSIDNDRWLCAACKARQTAPSKLRTGLLGPCIDQIERMNPSAFSLPSDCRDHFKNVEFGDNGEYVENLPRKSA